MDPDIRDNSIQSLPPWVAVPATRSLDLQRGPALIDTCEGEGEGEGEGKIETTGLQYQHIFHLSYR